MMAEQTDEKLREAMQRLRGWGDFAAVMGPRSGRQMKRLRSAVEAFGVDMSLVVRTRLSAEGEHDLIDGGLGSPLLQGQAVVVPTSKLAAEFGDCFNDDYECQVNEAVKKACCEVFLQKPQLPVPTGFRSHVMEVFSPPRFVPKAKEKGMVGAGSWDLQCGWDVFKAEDRARFWRAYAHHRPYMVTLSPECRVFSALMRTNWDRMDPVVAEALRQRGIEMLMFAMLVAAAQIRCGGKFLFEHPLFASSWFTETVKLIASLPQVRCVRVDMCAFGLQVSEDGLSFKPTGLMTNDAELARAMEGHLCTKDHEHVKLENGLPKKAQVYPKKFVSRVLYGTRRSVLDRIGPKMITAFPELGNDDDEDEEDFGDDPGEEPERPDEQGEGVPAVPPEPALTEPMKKSVEKLHVNMGHPELSVFLRVLKAGGAKESVLEYVRSEFKCDSCLRRGRPRPDGGPPCLALSSSTSWWPRTSSTSTLTGSRWAC